MPVQYNVLVRKEKQFGNFDFRGDITMLDVRCCDVSPV